MKFTPSLLALMLCAASVTAQQSTTPPARPAAPVPATTPTPAPAPARPPAPARAPRATTIGPDWDMSDRVYIDGQRVRMEAERMARETTDRSFEAMQRSQDAMQRTQEATERAMARVTDRSMETTVRATERAMEDAQRALERSQRAFERTNWGDALPSLAHLSGQISSTVSSSVAAAMADADFAYAFSPSYNSTYSFQSLKAYSPDQSRWEWQPETDPADSLYRVAQDAMNRGDYRRSADLFAQVQTKYPKSTRITRAAYNESLMRYRLGSTDELRTALRVLTDKSRISTSVGDFGNEVSNLTMRVRGALAQRGDAEQQRLVAQEAQKSGCDREDMQVRAEALSAIASSDMNTATPMLRRVLDKKDPCTLELRRSALRILLRRQDTAATSAAISVAKNNDETLELRVDAVNALSRLPGDNAVATLEELLRTSTDREIQRAAVRALSNTENTRARSSVRMLIERNDVSEALRSEALSSFSKERNSPEDATYLRNLYPKMQSENLKSSVLSAISRMGGAENDQFLLAVARNTGEASETRSTAINRLNRSTTTISVSDFSKLYDAAESRSLRSQIVSVLGQRKEPEALEKLIDILKNSTDANIRSQVVGTLSRNTDPKARQALLDAAGR